MADANFNLVLPNIYQKMARPIAPTPVLKGKDAERFLKEKERIENLDPDSPEAKQREAFFKECIELYNRTKPKNV